MPLADTSIILRKEVEDWDRVGEERGLNLDEKSAGDEAGKKLWDLNRMEEGPMLTEIKSI